MIPYGRAKCEDLEITQDEYIEFLKTFFLLNNLKK